MVDVPDGHQFHCDHFVLFAERDLHYRFEEGLAMVVHGRSEVLDLLL